MKRLTLTRAFATYGAELRNSRWAFSAIASDGSLVLSCWKHFLKTYVDGHQRYEDRLSRWKTNTPGRQLLIEHLQLATAKNLPVRMIVATLQDPSDRTIEGAGMRPKTFTVHPDMIGRVVEYDGDQFAIDFQPH
jgi:putative restriction endonuclease